MYLKTESSYISGLLNMASSCSKTIGLSYADAECFNKDKYKNDFSKLHKIKEIDLSLEKLNITFKELLTNIFGDEKEIIEGLSHWINLIAGTPNKVSMINDKTIIEKISNIPFYFLEDVFFIECENMVICILIGNDE